MNKNQIRWILVLMFPVLFCFGRAHADPVTVQCPETLDVSQSAAAVGDWQVYDSSTTHSFSRLRIYNGHPKGKVALDPDNADEQPVNYQWTLGDAGDSLWVECSYHGATMRLVRPLSKGLHSCETEKLDHTLGLHCE